MRLLSIVMPSLTQRLERCTIVRQIHEQAAYYQGAVEFLSLLDNGPLSTGAKLRTLYSLCTGRYICGVGDDDSVADDYVASLVKAILDHDVDAVTFDHSYSVDGCPVALTKQIPGVGEHQFRKRGDEDLEIHHRLPGPLCPVRAEIVREFDVPDKSDREDCEYKQFLVPRIKTHHNIDRVLYHHQWVSANKREREQLKAAWGRG